MSAATTIAGSFDIGVSFDAQPSHRLRYARRQRYRYMRDFVAQTDGLNYSTYAQHEAGTRPLSEDAATEYARYLGVSSTWLLYGEASQADTTCRIVGTVGAQAVVAPIEFTRGGAVFVPSPPVPADHYDVLPVTDKSLEPFAYKGSTLYFRPPRPLSAFHREKINGRWCVVHLEDGDITVRRVIPQSATIATLLTWDDKVIMMGAKVRRIAPILWVGLAPFVGLT